MMVGDLDLANVAHRRIAILEKALRISVAAAMNVSLDSREVEEKSKQIIDIAQEEVRKVARSQ